MTAAPIKVLVVDDEPPIRKLLRMGLGTQGYQTLDAPNAKAALELLASKPDLVILDLGLPDMQGLELLRQIRARTETVPIVVLSSRGDEDAKVAALDQGADDYVTKPFGMEELLARIRTALRHQLQVHGERPVFALGDLSVDLVRRIVKVRGKEVKLSPKEYELLRVMVQHAGKVLTHKFLLKELWASPIDPQYLRVYVRQLRQKIEPDPPQPRYILTETGIGYRLYGAGVMAATMRVEAPMKVSDFLSPDRVLVDVRESDKVRLLERLSTLAAAAVELDAGDIVREVTKREVLGSTGVGDGVALPHARLRGLGAPFGVLARLSHPIDFDAIDGKPVDIVFLLLLPEAERSRQGQSSRLRCPRAPAA